jgi:hypothetical protein
MNKTSTNHGFTELIKSAVKVLIVPIVLLLITFYLNETLQRRDDINRFLNTSSKLEEAYRGIKNHYEALGQGVNFDPSVFWEKMTILDHNMISFYFKVMTLDIPSKSRYEDARKAASLFDVLYWGKGTVGGQYSVRQYLIKYEALAREDLGSFIKNQTEIKDTLQYIDDLMHLVMLSSLLVVHREGEEVQERFRQIGDDIRKLKKAVEFSKLDDPSNPINLRKPQHIKAALDNLGS